MITIALDAMGGDLGPSAVVGGASLYYGQHQGDEISFLLFGKKDAIEAELKKYGNLTSGCCSVVESDKLITADMKPSVAVRNGRGSSMFEAIKAVALGKADAVVSSGNTGAYMALSKLLLKMIDKIERPALVNLLPNLKSQSVVLDLGANVDCSSTNLIQFAIMGMAVARVLLKINAPSVSLLNIGTERSKGTDALKCAADFLEKASNINFIGFVEGSDLASGKADVIVTDGFSGNVALKAIEGTIKYLATLLKKEVQDSVLGKIAYIFSGGIVKSLKNAIDPRNHNGAILVGLDGIAIKSHGNSDHVGFANAISVAVKFAQQKLVDDIKHEIHSVEREEQR